jgi:hypothetical protein
MAIYELIWQNISQKPVILYFHDRPTNGAFKNWRSIEGIYWRPFEGMLKAWILLSPCPTETLVEFDFGCKFMIVTGKIEFCAAAIIQLINANGGRRFGVRNVSFNVASSGIGIYDLMIKSYCSVVVVKFTTKVAFY